MTTNLAQNALFFFPVAGFIVAMALGVLFADSPIKALVSLIMSMLGIGVLFLAKGAVFLGGAQLAVYAGAVMVLFLMVLMLMDVNEVTDRFFKDKASAGKFVKVGSVGVVLGLSMGALSLKTYNNAYQSNVEVTEAVKHLAMTLFKRHMFLFELIGVLLLVIAVAVVAVSRSGGEKK